MLLSNVLSCLDGTIFFYDTIAGSVDRACMVRSKSSKNGMIHDVLWSRLSVLPLVNTKAKKISRRQMQMTSENV